LHWKKGYPFCSITGTVIISSAPTAWIPQVFMELFFVEHDHRSLWHAVPSLDKWSFLRLLMGLVAYRWLQPSVFNMVLYVSMIWEISIVETTCHETFQRWRLFRRSP